MKGENSYMVDLYWLLEQEKLNAASAKEEILLNEESISGYTVAKCNFERSKLSPEEAASKILIEWMICRILSIQMNRFAESQHGGWG